MKRLMAGIALLIGTAALSGCYYDPGYSYVRSTGYQGDAYYGDGGGAVYDEGYAPAYYAAPGYYGSGYYGGYGSGVNVDIGTVWYSGSRGRYRGRGYDDRRWRGSDHDHGWQRGRGGEVHYSHRDGDMHRSGGYHSRGGNDRSHGRHGDHDGH
jgi:hypothetical protein